MMYKYEVLVGAHRSKKKKKKLVTFSTLGGEYKTGAPGMVV